MGERRTSCSRMGEAAEKSEQKSFFHHSFSFILSDVVTSCSRMGEAAEKSEQKSFFFIHSNLIHFGGCCDFLFCCKILHRVSKLAESYSAVSYLCSIHT